MRVGVRVRVSVRVSVSVRCTSTWGQSESMSRPRFTPNSPTPTMEGWKKCSGSRLRVWMRARMGVTVPVMKASTRANTLSNSVALCSPQVSHGCLLGGEGGVNVAHAVGTVLPLVHLTAEEHSDRLDLRVIDVYNTHAPSGSFEWFGAQVICTHAGSRRQAALHSVSEWAGGVAPPHLPSK